MKKESKILRLSRNILIALFSTGWLVPLVGFIDELFSWLYESHQDSYTGVADCGLRLHLSFAFFEIAMIWLGIVIFFWVFVAANRFWSIKGKTKQQAP